MTVRSKVFQLIVGLGFLTSLWAVPALALEGRIDVDAGPIRDNQDAQQKCQAAMEQWHKDKTYYDVRWTGQWKQKPTGNGAVCGIRYIKRDDWTAKPIDMRPISSSERVNGCSDKAKGNGWINDDMCRDKLVMDADKLGWVTVMSKDALATLDTGRYIFVLRKTIGDNGLMIRRYDRNHDVSAGTCDNSKYLYSGNKQTIKDTSNQHVRHSQLNSNKGGAADPWRDVWSAGEMWIQNGKITAITNESGHFKPSKASLRYVKETLNFLSIPTEDTILFAWDTDHAKIAPLRNQCVGGKVNKSEL